MTPPRLGIHENLAQFSLLVLVNAFVGAMVGLERSLLPGLAESQFHVAAKVGVLSFIAVFGVSKALTNYAAGRLADAHGRKRVLVAGWLVALPVPALLYAAPDWSWVLAANALLGVSQGLTWSTAVIMKIDLAGPRQRGLAMGLNEFAGYLAVAGSAALTGALAAHGVGSTAPFGIGFVYALVGLVLSVALVRETHAHVAVEQPNGPPPPAARDVFHATTWRHPDLSSVTQAGLVNNLNDGMAWGLFPLLFAASGVPAGTIALLVALYPAVWGVSQLVTGAMSDRTGRKPLIVAGMLTQAGGILLVAYGQAVPAWAAGQVLLGVGTAMVYPTLLAAIGDVAAPSWRASSVGVYRLWRDLGYAFGAVLAGLVADALGLRWAIAAVALLTAASGAWVALRMRETHILATVEAR